MTKVTLASGEVIDHHGWRVVFAGLGINLALGILYTWSVISGSIPEEWEWTATEKSLPYMFACLTFSIIMVPAGRMQDKISPRFTASLGGILVGIGFVTASLTQSPIGYLIGFGILAGAGIGFGYASATPPVVKWFPPAKTGMIAGLVVSGFGLASVYAAPLAKWLSASYGLQTMMMVLGIAFLVVVVALAQLLKPPHKVLQWIQEYGDVGRAKKEAMARDEALKKGEPIQVKKEEFTPKEMIKTPQFYILWFMYACGAGAGLMIISVAMKIVSGAQATAETAQAAETIAIAAVVGLAIGNGGGRILAGMLSDKIGRKATLFMCFVFQAILIFLLTQAQDGGMLENNAAALIVITALIGANYGSNLALFPSFTKDFYGLKNFGTNYGLVFTAWGVGGFMLSFLAGKMYDIHQTFSIAYYGASALLILAAIAVFLLKVPHHLEEATETASTDE